MVRRKSKLFSFSIFQWFCKSIAIVLGIAPSSRRNRRLYTKRCNNGIVQSKTFRKRNSSQIKELVMDSETHFRANIDCENSCGPSKIPIINTNNNRSLNDLAHGDMNINRLSHVDHRRILCIQVDSDKTVDYIQDLLMKNASICKTSRIIDFQALVSFIQSTANNVPLRDAWTMTNTDPDGSQPTSCISLMKQSENARRLKALEFIRLFIEKSKEDFCQYLLNEEHLCQQKTLIVYEMIQQFLRIIYQSEHEQKL